MDAFIAKHKLKGNVAFAEMSSYMRIFTAKSGDIRFLDFHADYTKWYDSYNEVRAFMALLDDVDEMNDPSDEDAPSERKRALQYEFVRIGEEHNDIEYKQSYAPRGYIYPQTNIVDDLPDAREEPNEED
jgi:hypothetical protein